MSARAVQMCLHEVLLYADGEDAVMHAEAAHVVAMLVEDVLDGLDPLYLHRAVENGSSV
jgi:hypothetical protein